MSTFETPEAMSAAMQKLGITADRAQRQAREYFAKINPELLAAADKSQLRADMILEKEEQQEVIKRLRVCKFKVYSLSQARASKQTPGLSDLWCVHLVDPIAFWWETKRQVGGRHSDAQSDFALECRRTGVGYYTGDRYEAERVLVRLELGQMFAWGLECVERLRGI
jgi:hypothetical protein